MLLCEIGIKKLDIILQEVLRCEMDIKKFDGGYFCPEKGHSSCFEKVRTIFPNWNYFDLFNQILQWQIKMP